MGGIYSGEALQGPAWLQQSNVIIFEDDVQDGREGFWVYNDE